MDTKENGKMTNYLSGLYDNWHFWCNRAAQLSYNGKSDAYAVGKADEVMGEIEYYQDAQADAAKYAKLPWSPLVSCVPAGELMVGAEL